MNCRNCGQPVQPGAYVCTACGVPVGQGNRFCPHCAAQTAAEAIFCVRCGQPLTPPGQPYAPVPPGVEQKSRLVAGLLGIFLGYLGIHNFYLGNSSRGILQIILTCITCGAAGLWGFIEGIMILAGSINTDANGVPLKE